MVGSKAVILKGVKPEYILEAVSRAGHHCMAAGSWAQDILEAIETGQIDLVTTSGPMATDAYRSPTGASQPD